MEAQTDESVDYKLDDLVRVSDYDSPFKVIGVRANEIEVEGDFSGMGIAIQNDWISIEHVTPFIYGDAAKWTLNSKPGADTEVWVLALYALLVRINKPRYGNAVINCQWLNIFNHTSHWNNIDMVKMEAVNLVTAKMQHVVKSYEMLKKTRQNHLAGKFD